MLIMQSNTKIQQLICEQVAVFMMPLIVIAVYHKTGLTMRRRNFNVCGRLASLEVHRQNKRQKW